MIIPSIYSIRIRTHTRKLCKYTTSARVFDPLNEYRFAPAAANPLGRIMARQYSVSACFHQAAKKHTANVMFSERRTRTEGNPRKGSRRSRHKGVRSGKKIKKLVDDPFGKRSTYYILLPLPFSPSSASFTSVTVARG